jgi:Tfp pilus assembly protein PilO
VKKKLAALNIKVQLGVVAVILIGVGFAGYTFVVAPQGAQAKSLQKQIAAQNILTFQRKAALRAGERPPTIKVADLFRLARAMPDREDMPGIILTLSQVARASGISFALIEPVAAAGPVASGSYQTQRIHLLFNGDFYGLSDFLYRLRSMVTVRHGNLQADGRLFTADTVTFAVQGNTFPEISADIFVDAYVYSAATGAAGATTPSTTTPTTTTPATTATDPSLPTGATAAGATP